MRGLSTAIAIVCGLFGLATLVTSERAQAQLHLPPARAPCSILSGGPCHPTFCSAFQRGPCFPQYQPALGEELRLTIESKDDDDAPPGNSNPPVPGHPPPATITFEGVLYGTVTVKSAGDQTGSTGQERANEHTLDSIAAMYGALRGCWVPPPKAKARHGMEYTILFAFKRDGDVVAPPRVTYASHDAPAAVRDVYRDAVDAALTRCTPLHFTDSMGGAIAGHPIALRFIDNRTVDQPNSPR
jgi:hypothetical protein